MGLGTLPMRCVFTVTASQTLDGRDAPPPEFGGMIDALRFECDRHAGCISPDVKYRDARIAHVIALMAMHRSDPLPVEELARKVNLSPSYLTRLFRDETGSAPVTFDRAQRLERAHDLIRNSFLSIKQVMAEVGWSDPSHFCRDFKRRFGVTPRALRRQGRG